MPANYVLLEKITVGAAGASSVTFSGIPQTGYTDLVVTCSTRGNRTNATDALSFKFNSDSTAANYSVRSLFGTGSAAGSFSSSTYSDDVAYISGNSATANTFGSTVLYAPNYTSSTTKSFSVDSVGEDNSSAIRMNMTAYLWSGTAAITSINIFNEIGTSFIQYSTFYLYGVAKLGTTPAIVPYATGGDTIMTDGTYWYHTFVSSGTFTPQKAITCDYLVVAGGGGGSHSDGAGAGAGGYRTSIGGSPLSLSTSAVTVTVGAGGAGGTNSTNHTSGSNSVFSTITSSGGGRAGYYDINGSAGGSGGGGGYDTGAGTTTGGAGNSGSYSPVEGYAGGTSATNSGGGGGGSSQVGYSNGTYLIRASGGNGTANSISGTSVTYAGGGGAGTSGSGVTPGTGGTGGGGGGGTRAGINGVAGTANTGGGGGGGGGSTTSNGGAGGSGIVIVRYAV
jgi:hypothetical protein